MSVAHQDAMLKAYKEDEGGADDADLDKIDAMEQGEEEQGAFCQLLC